MPANPWMPIGRMRSKITIQQLASSANVGGEVADTWENLYANVPAAVERDNGGERLTDRTLLADVTHKITLRYLSGITTKMIVLLDGKTLDIQFVNDIQDRRRQLVLTCKERI